MNIYLAGPIFNSRQIQTMTTLRDLSEGMPQVRTFSPYHASRAIWLGRAPKDCTEEERRQVLQQNIDNLSWADVVLCVLNREDGGYDGRTDTGVVWEMGYATAIGRRVVGWVDPDVSIPDKGVNLMLAGTIDAVLKGYLQYQEFLNMVVDDRWDLVEEIFTVENLISHEEDPIS